MDYEFFVTRIIFLTACRRLTYLDYKAYLALRPSFSFSMYHHSILSFLHLSMADPFGTTLAVLSAISIVTKSVVAFSKAIEGLRAHYKTIQDLWDELTALETVLVSLHKAFESDPARFSLLAFPLERCGQACEDFSIVIKKCVVHSDGSKPSIRDWATLKYMGSDISGFLRMLEEYKMTICIALETVNM